MTIKPFANLPFLLCTVLLCCGAAGSDSLEIPRQNVPAVSFNVVPVTSTTEEFGSVQPGQHRMLTAHYNIMASLRDNSELVGQRLEHLCHVWEWLGTEFIKEAKKKPAPQRHRVILYRNHQEYTLHLFRIDPRIAQTNGFYYAPRKTAYFFSTEAKILFHEGTHQILAERVFHEKKPVFHNNFWVVEGIALFMETLKVKDKHYTIGDILANRLYSAKRYRFEQGHKLPIQKLVAMSASEIQSQPRDELQRIYSQSATLVHWLMFAEEGRYRPALFELLRQTYHDSATAETLSKLTGLSYDKLDEQYEEFLKTIPE